KFLQDFSEAERRAYVEANAAALRALLPADLVFTNHVLMGGPVGAASGAPFRVKAHGSELEYSIRGRPQLGGGARETLARADATYVGSEHIREVLADVVGHTDRVFDVPPGVDIDRFVLQDRGAALEDLLAEARKDPPNGGDERLPDDGNAQRLAAVLDGGGPPVGFFWELVEGRGGAGARGGRAARRLLREADRGERRAGAARGDAWSRCPARCRRVRAVPLNARIACPFAHAVHGAARAPSSPAPAAARRRHGGAVDLPRGVRNGRGRGRRRRVAPARRPALGTRGGCGRTGRGVSRALPPPSIL